LELLTTRRADLERAALDRLTRRLARAADGAGVALDGFTLHDLHPPPEVVNAYHAVAKAIQERDRAINDATADALRIRRRAEEEADRALKRATADAHAALEAARADRAAFLALHAARVQLTDAEEAALARERDARLKAGQPAAGVGADLAARRAGALAERRAILDARLTYQALTEALQGRDKVLIDSGDVPGRRHLFLLDPDLLRFPAPVAPLNPEK
jgi:regulator of protease activity HflC (stomatin/prohibitin superfamily)